jgi:hypothetical protein
MVLPGKQGQPMTYVKLGLSEAYSQCCTTTATAVLEICDIEKFEDKKGFMGLQTPSGVAWYKNDIESRR